MKGTCSLIIAFKQENDRQHLLLSHCLTNLVPMLGKLHMPTLCLGKVWLVWGRRSSSNPNVHVEAFIA